MFRYGKAVVFLKMVVQCDGMFYGMFMGGSKAVFVEAAPVFEPLGGLGNGGSGGVGRVLPVRDACVPAELVVGLDCPVAEIGLCDPACVGGVGGEDGLGDNELIVGDAPGVDLLDGSAVEISSGGVDEELVVGVVLGVDLVVALQHVEVDEVADVVVDGLVAAVDVVLVLEVGGLRAVAQDVVRDHCAHCLRELYQPVLASAAVHRLVVLPVHVPAVQVVVQDELSELRPARYRVLPG